MYDKKVLMRYVTILGMVMGAMYVTKGIGFLIVIPLILAALAKGKADQLLFYLLLVIAMLMGNQYLMPKPMIFAIAQRALIIALGMIMLFRLGGKRNSPAIKPFLFMLVYIASVSLSSFVGWNPLISMLKIFLFIMVFLAYYGIANEAIIDRNLALESRVRSAVLSFAIFFVLGSVALIPFPGISQMSGLEFEMMLRSGQHVTSLFKGMTMHAQSLGPATAILFVALLGDLTFSIKKADKLYLLLLISCPILIFKTSSRTAMGSMVFGSAVVLWYAMKMRGIGARWRSKVVGVSVGLVSVFLAAALLVPSVRQGILNFALKFGEADMNQGVAMEEVLSTRQGKWEEGIANWKKNPFIGNGFQVSEDMANVKADSIKDILTAPVEKSVWVSAVLEESGIIGFAVFMLFIAAVFFKSSQQKLYTGLACFLVLLVSNLGEFTIFSMSYTGGFQWAVVFAGYVLDALRIKRESQSMYYMGEAW